MSRSTVPGPLNDKTEGLATRWFDPLMPVEGMADLVRRVKNAGYGVYLLSNAGVRHSEYWNKIPGSEYFDGIVVSAYEKLVKPQPEIYKVLLERFKLVPEECLFVDDREINLAGAAICGMQSVAFRSAVDLEKSLRERGIILDRCTI